MQDLELQVDWEVYDILSETAYFRRKRVSCDRKFICKEPVGLASTGNSVEKNEVLQAGAFWQLTS